MHIKTAHMLEVMHTTFLVVSGISILLQLAFYSGRDSGLVRPITRRGKCEEKSNGNLYFEIG